jgi:Flp pilus assembly protein TadD
VLRLQPENQVASRNLGVALRATGREKEALQAFDRADHLAGRTK